MDQLLRPAIFNPASTNEWKEWAHWKAKFEMFTAGIEDVTDNNKMGLLLNFVSADVYSYISNTDNYHDAIAALDKVYSLRNNVLQTRHLFNTVSKADRQSEAIRDAFISGVLSVNIRQRFFESDKTGLNEIENLAKDLETARPHNRNVPSHPVAGANESDSEWHECQGNGYVTPSHNLSQSRSLSPAQSNYRSPSQSLHRSQSPRPSETLRSHTVSPCPFNRLSRSPFRLEHSRSSRSPFKPPFGTPDTPQSTSTAGKLSEFPGSSSEFPSSSTSRSQSRSRYSTSPSQSPCRRSSKNSSCSSSLSERPSHTSSRHSSSPHSSSSESITKMLVPENRSPYVLCQRTDSTSPQRSPLRSRSPSIITLTDSSSSSSPQRSPIRLTQPPRKRGRSHFKSASKSSDSSTSFSPVNHRIQINKHKFAENVFTHNLDSILPIPTRLRIQNVNKSKDSAQSSSFNKQNFESPQYIVSDDEDIMQELSPNATSSSHNENQSIVIEVDVEPSEPLINEGPIISDNEETDSYITRKPFNKQARFTISDEET